LDPTFGSGGVVTANFGGVVATPYRIALQADGAIVVAALWNGTLLVARYLEDGTPDCSFGTTTFGNVGTRTVQIGVSELPGMAIAADGRIYAVATTTTLTVADEIVLLRFTTSGWLDARTVFHLSPGLDLGHGLAIQTDGKIIAAGRTWTPAGGWDFF